MLEVRQPGTVCCLIFLSITWSWSWCSAADSGFFRKTMEVGGLFCEKVATPPWVSYSFLHCKSRSQDCESSSTVLLDGSSVSGAWELASFKGQLSLANLLRSSCGSCTLHETLSLCSISSKAVDATLVKVVATSRGIWSRAACSHVCDTASKSPLISYGRLSVATSSQRESTRWFTWTASRNSSISPNESSMSEGVVSSDWPASFAPSGGLWVQIDLSLLECCPKIGVSSIFRSAKRFPGAPKLRADECRRLLFVHLSFGLAQHLHKSLYITVKLEQCECRGSCICGDPSHTCQWSAHGSGCPCQFGHQR